MVDCRHSGDELDEFIKGTKLFQAMKAESKEIDRLKWLESEKAGFDIGGERAFYTWVIKYKKHWEKSHQD